VKLQDPMLELAHAVRFHKRYAPIARKALAERDALRAEVARLRRSVAQTPKFQGMTELA
jgi:hypothetical protein